MSKKAQTQDLRRIRRGLWKKVGRPTFLLTEEDLFSDLDAVQSSPFTDIV